MGIIPIHVIPNHIRQNWFYTKSRYTKSLYTKSRYTKSRYTKSRYTKSHYTKSRYTKQGSAKKKHECIDFSDITRICIFLQTHLVTLITIPRTLLLLEATTLPSTDRGRFSSI
jgi:hypothetical protein